MEIYGVDINSRTSSKSRKGVENELAKELKRFGWKLRQICGQLPRGDRVKKSPSKQVTLVNGGVAEVVALSKALADAEKSKKEKSKTRKAQSKCQRHFGTAKSLTDTY